MNDIIDKIARILCKSSSNYEEICPFCENDKCQPKMWISFRKEAEAVYNFMKNEKLLKDNKFLLPGLGG